MPISQSRMIALINSAIDYKQALDRLINIVANTPPTSTAEHLLVFAHLPSLLNDPINTPSTLAIEYAHFKRNARRNNTRARKAAAARQQHGVIPRATTPRGITLTTTPHSTYFPSDLQTPNYTSTPLTNEQKQKILEEINSGIYDDDNTSPAGANLSNSTKAKILAEVEQHLAEPPSCPTCGEWDVYSCPRGISNCKWHDRMIQLEAETAAKADEDFEEGLN